MFQMNNLAWQNSMILTNKMCLYVFFSNSVNLEQKHVAFQITSFRLWLHGIYILFFFLESADAESIKQASEQLNNRWTEFCQLLSERVNWLEYQNNIITFYNQLQHLEQITTTAENWLKTQPTIPSELNTIKSQLKICKVKLSSFLWSIISRYFLENCKRAIAKCLVMRFFNSRGFN